MRSLLACLLLIPSVCFGQTRVSVPAKVETKVIYDDSTLDVGQHVIFDFNPTDGSKPFGGKSYKIECESRDTSDVATFWRGKVEVPGKAELQDQAIIFAGEDSPDNMVVRVLVDNGTVYRHNITVNKKKLPPGPAPYVDVLSKAVAADAGTQEQVNAHALVYKMAVSKVSSFATGKDCWDWIDLEYRRIQPLAQTRLAIANILYDTTRSYYDSKLTTADRKVFTKVLGDLQRALEAIKGGDVGPVVPVGPKKLWLIVVEETSDAATNRGAWFNNAELVNKIKSSGHKHRIIEQNSKDASGQVPADAAPYITRAKDAVGKGKSLPYLFLVDQATGTIYLQDNLPKTPAELTALLTKIGG